MRLKVSPSREAHQPLNPHGEGNSQRCEDLERAMPASDYFRVARDPAAISLVVAFLDFRNEESHDVNCHPVRVEALVVGEENDGQVGIEKMCVFNHTGADVKDYSMAVENVCVPPSCKLPVTPIVQAERRPHEFQGLPVQDSAVTQRHVESSKIPSAHVQANAAMLVLGIEKVDVVPEFAVARW